MRIGELIKVLNVNRALQVNESWAVNANNSYNVLTYTLWEGIQFCKLILYAQFFNQYFIQKFIIFLIFFVHAEWEAVGKEIRFMSAEKSQDYFVYPAPSN